VKRRKRSKKKILYMTTLNHNNDILAQRYASDFSIPLELAHIVAKRYPDYSTAKELLFPDICNLYDPQSIPDIDVAAEDIISSIQSGERVLIYCHDDPDGYTSAVIMYKTLIDLSRRKDDQVYIYPIIREQDGYILNPTVLKNYKKKGFDLVITVDFGISNEDNFHNAQQANMKLIVCDHHETNCVHFAAPAVNPKRSDSQYPFRELAGVGVTFKLAQVLYQKAFNLQPSEFFSLKKDFFLFVLIGSIADRVPLVGENRIFCSYGLSILGEMNEPWMRYWSKEDVFTLKQITKEVIPILSSAAYLDSNLGIEMLLSKDELAAFDIIQQLKVVNDERRQTIAVLFKEALAAAKIFPDIVVSIIPFSKHHYLGPVASRLRDYFHKTVVVVGSKDEKYVGELRSACIDLYTMLNSFSTLFYDFGGHKKAAGFSMSRDNLDIFIENAVAYSTQHRRDITSNCTGSSDTPELFLKKSDIGILRRLAPFGEGNPAPLLTDGTSIYTIDNAFEVVDVGKEG
jgi:single-stranded-DNA-specific exonuclease